MIATTVHANTTALLNIEMRPQVKVIGNHVSLGDIAYLRSPDLTVMRRAMNLKLGRSPRFDDVASLNSDSIGRWLYSQTGLNTNQVSWTGASVTEIRRSSSVIASRVIVETAQTSVLKLIDEIRKKNGFSISRIDIEPTKVPVDYAVPAENISFVARPLSARTISKRLLVWVDAFLNDEFVLAIPVHFDLSIYAIASVSNSQLAAGQIAESSHVSRRLMDVTSLINEKGFVPIDFTNDSQKNKRYLRRIRDGEVVTIADLEANPAVYRGDWVTLTAQNGSVAIESRIEVLQDGYPGQMVRVKSTNGGKVFWARVSSSGQLQIQP